MDAVEELIEKIHPTFEFMGYLLRILEKKGLQEKNFYQNSLAFYALSGLRSSGFDIELKELKEWLKQKVTIVLEEKEPINSLFEGDNFLALCFGVRALTDFDEFLPTQNRIDNFKKIIQEIEKRNWLEDIRNPSIFLFCFNKDQELRELITRARKEIEGKYQRFKAEGDVPQQTYSILGLSSLERNLDDDIETILEKHKPDTSLLSILLLSAKQTTKRNRIYSELTNNLQAIFDKLRPYISDFLYSLQLKKLDFNEDQINNKFDLINVKNTSHRKFEVKLLRPLSPIKISDICLAVISAYHTNLLKTYGIISQDQLETYKKGKDIGKGYFPFNRTELSFLIFLLYIPFAYLFFLWLPPTIGWGAAIAIFLLSLELVYSFIREGSFKRDKLYSFLKKVWSYVSKTR